MTPRYDAKIDANQPEIVEALRAVGATVLILSRVGQGCPDLGVGYRKRNYFMEVKNLEGRGDALTAEELEFFNTWAGQTAIVRTVDEALALIGAVEYGPTINSFIDCEYMGATECPGIELRDDTDNEYIVEGTA